MIVGFEPASGRPRDHFTLPALNPFAETQLLNRSLQGVCTMTDKANEPGWGSTVKAASEQIQATTDAVAEKIRGTVGDTVADGLKTGGEYTKAGIQNTGEYVGLKGSKVRQLQAHSSKSVTAISH